MRCSTYPKEDCLKSPAGCNVFGYDCERLIREARAEANRITPPADDPGDPEALPTDFQLAFERAHESLKAFTRPSGAVYPRLQPEIVAAVLNSQAILAMATAQHQLGVELKKVTEAFQTLNEASPEDDDDDPEWDPEALR